MEYQLNNTSEMPEKRKGLKVASFFIIILILMSISFFSGVYIAGKSDVIKKMGVDEAFFLGNLTGKYSKVNGEKIIQNVDFNLFWDVWDLLESKFVYRDKLNDKTMFYGALKGLVSSAEDPYTVFMDPKISKEFNDDLSGKFEGIGAEIGIKNEVLTIISPISNSPAQKAGLKAGDQIIFINGTSTIGMSTEEAVKKIRGPKGTEVTLTILKKNESKTKDFKIIRDTIKIDSIITSNSPKNNFSKYDKNIFIIKITNFNGDTLELFEKAVYDVMQKNPKGIILDLRNNPGGYLDTAIDIASEWIDKGTIVSEKFSDKEKVDHPARGNARLKNYKTVVLVNEGSASASEIVAGALQDYNLATIVGKKTFGKGSVQTVENLPDGSSVKITIAEWLTPKGNNINKEGIKPSVEIDLSEKDYNENRDPQMEKAVEIINENKK